MKALILSNGNRALVDDDDADRIEKVRWHNSSHNPPYAVSYIYREGRRHQIYLHRFVMNAEPTEIVDHINRHRLDCRKQNLRIATDRENKINKYSLVGRSGFRGVWPTHGGRGFQAMIKSGSRRIYIGTFTTLLEAASAYDSAARMWFGKFAVLNFQDSAGVCDELSFAEKIAAATPLMSLTDRVVKTPEEHFNENIMPEPNSGCWLYIGRMNAQGYGLLRVMGKTVSAHRFSWVSVCGEIPAGLQLDHKCRVRCCVNPDHLELVTPRENWSRGIAPTALNAAKRECKYGHSFTEENTYRMKGGGRRCRQCDRRAGREWYASRGRDLRASRKIVSCCDQAGANYNGDAADKNATARD